MRHVEFQTEPISQAIGVSWKEAVLNMLYGRRERVTGICNVDNETFAASFESDRKITPT